METLSFSTWGERPREIAISFLEEIYVQLQLGLRKKQNKTVHQALREIPGGQLLFCVPFRAFIWQG